MSHPVSPYDRDESFLEKHLGLAIVLSVGLHALIGWLFLLVLPNLLEAKRGEKPDYITVQLFGDIAPPAPAAPADLPVNPKATGPDVVERPKTPGEPAPPQFTPTPPAPVTAPADIIPLGPKAPAKPPEIKKKATPPPKVTPPKVEQPKPKPKQPSLDDQIAQSLRKVERTVEGREQTPSDSDMVNRSIEEGRGQGEGSQRGGASSGERWIDPRMRAYFRHIKDIIESNWVLPPGGHVIKQNLIYELVIQPSGQISSVKLGRSSGSSDVDISVERAINKSNPLPPPPEVFENRTAEVAIGFDQATVKRRLQQ